MSTEALFWAMKQAPKTSTQKYLLMCLANYADARGRAYPKQSTIAEFTLLSERTVRSTLAELEEAGYIRREQRNREDGTRRVDVAHLNFKRWDTPPDAIGEEPDDQPATVAGGSTGKNCRSQPAKIAAQEPITSEPPTKSSLPSDEGRRGPSSMPPEIDWRERVFNQDAPKIAALAGCSLSQAKKRIGALAKGCGWELAKLSEAIGRTIEARPAGDPFAYCQTLLAKPTESRQGMGYVP